MNPVYKYFSGLTTEQINKINLLKDIYSQWNERINVISRKDMDSFYEHHVLHSLSIAKFITFKSGSKIIDVGTGGGFPGIPLAILFPQISFTLLDSIGKKIKVVSAVAEALQLKNVKTINSRSEQHKEQYDFIVSRAVTSLPLFVKQTRHLISLKQQNAIGNGILYLKGGDLTQEIKPFKKEIFITNLNDFFEEEFFTTKKLLHLSL